MSARWIALTVMVLTAGCTAGPSPVAPQPATPFAVSAITIAPVTIQPQVIPLNNGYIEGPAQNVPVQGAFSVHWSSLDKAPEIEVGIASGLAPDLFPGLIPTIF